MRRPVFLSLMLLAATTLSAATGGGGTPPVKPPAVDPIARLDQCVQQRFLNVRDRTFGMRRVLPYGHYGITQFQPVSSYEHQVVDELAKNGYQVSVFIAGLNILQAPGPDANYRSKLQGPAYIANVTASDLLPDQDQLLAESRKALQFFSNPGSHSEGYDIHDGRWTVAFRPLRAESDRCVGCHTAGLGGQNRRLGAGDALGVAVYVYRR